MMSTLFFPSVEILFADGAKTRLSSIHNVSTKEQLFNPVRMGKCLCVMYFTAKSLLCHALLTHLNLGLDPGHTEGLCQHLCLGKKKKKHFYNLIYQSFQ